MVSGNSDQGSKKSKSSNRFSLGGLFHRRPKTHSQRNITDNETGTMNTQRLTTNTAPPYTLHGPQTTGGTSNTSNPTYASAPLSSSRSVLELPADPPTQRGVGGAPGHGSNAQGALELEAPGIRPLPEHFAEEPSRRYQLLIDETGFFIRDTHDRAEIFRLGFQGSRPIIPDAVEDWMRIYLRPGFNACVDDLEAIQRLIEVWGFSRQDVTAEPHRYIADLKCFISVCKNMKKPREIEKDEI